MRICNQHWQMIMKILTRFWQKLYLQNEKSSSFGPFLFPKDDPSNKFEDHQKVSLISKWIPRSSFHPWQKVFQVSDGTSQNLMKQLRLEIFFNSYSKETFTFFYHAIFVNFQTNFIDSLLRYCQIKNPMDSTLLKPFVISNMAFIDFFYLLWWNPSDSFIWISWFSSSISLRWLYSPLTKWLHLQKSFNFLLSSWPTCMSSEVLAPLIEPE